MLTPERVSFFVCHSNEIRPSKSRDKRPVESAASKLEKQIGQSYSSRSTIIISFMICCQPPRTRALNGRWILWIAKRRVRTSLCADSICMLLLFVVRSLPLLDNMYASESRGHFLDGLFAVYASMSSAINIPWCEHRPDADNAFPRRGRLWTLHQYATTMTICMRVNKDNDNLQVWRT